MNDVTSTVGTEPPARPKAWHALRNDILSGVTWSKDAQRGEAGQFAVWLWANHLVTVILSQMAIRIFSSCRICTAS
jgi:hypothetical protein